MKTLKVFGGSLLEGKRKSVRPLCTKRTINVVLKAERYGLARGQKLAKAEILKAAKRWGLKVYRITILIDHIHILIQIPTRAAYRFFIQRVCGSIALKLKLKWRYRPYSRIVEWGRDFKRARSYVEMNDLEAWGLIPYQPRGRTAFVKRWELAGMPPD